MGYLFYALWMLGLVFINGTLWKWARVRNPNARVTFTTWDLMSLPIALLPTTMLCASLLSDDPHHQRCSCGLDRLLCHAPFQFSGVFVGWLSGFGSHDRRGVPFAIIAAAWLAIIVSFFGFILIPVVAIIFAAIRLFWPRWAPGLTGGT